jgi:DNA-directed RNA polymerase subunit K/omega
MKLTERKHTPNKFEFVVVAGARAKQLLRGCTPRTSGNEKLVKLAQKEVREGKVERIAISD